MSDTTNDAVVFIGLGAIGEPMAARLVEAGLTVVGVEPSAPGRERAAADGINVVADLADIEPTTGTGVIMVATPAQLDAVATRILELGIADGWTWIVMATVGPTSVETVGARLGGAGASVIDAPVTGGAGRARTGELGIFASGSESALASARPVLDALGTAPTVGFALGAGQRVKVINQHLCAVHIAAAAEALALSERLGLDPGTVLDLIAGGGAGSWMLSDRGPRMLLGDDAPVLSQVGIFVKDTGLVADAARDSGASTPILQAARQAFLAAEDLGLVHSDDSQVIRVYQEGRR